MNWVYCTKDYNEKLLEEVIRTFGVEAHLEILYSPYEYKELKETVTASISYDESLIIVGEVVELYYGSFHDIQDKKFFKELL